MMDKFLTLKSVVGMGVTGIQTVTLTGLTILETVNVMDWNTIQKNEVLMAVIASLRSILAFHLIKLLS